MGIQIQPAIDRLCEQLKGVGLSPTIDPTEVSTDTGGVLIEPREVRDLTLGGGGTIVVWLYLCVANVEPRRVVALLDDALEGLLPLVDLSGTDDAPIDLAAAIRIDNQTTLPAYRVAIDLDMEEP